MNRIDPLLSPIGIGTFGYEQLDKQHAVKLIDCALDMGLTHIDTAEMYGWGESESRIGYALHGKRHKAFIGTKVWPRNASSKTINIACEQSLTRLQTDYIDLFSLHWPSPFPLDETMQGLLQLKAAGKIRHIGVSNFTAPLLLELQSSGYAGDILTNQVMYNLNERLAEQHVFQTCRDTDIAIVGYRPLSGGPLFKPTQDLNDIAMHYAKTPHQVALNFLHNHGDVFLIPRATKDIQLKQIAESLDFTLNPHERSVLSQAYPLTGPRDGVSLPIEANHYFRGDYTGELKNLFGELGLA